MGDWSHSLRNGRYTNFSDTTDAVDLRVRKVGDELSLSLEVPKRWGRLSARRHLVPLAHEKTILVRESIEGDRRQVLMVC